MFQTIMLINKVSEAKRKLCIDRTAQNSLPRQRSEKASFFLMRTTHVVKKTANTLGC
ncbi:MAG: hypothetical protein NTY48_01985 [Candidatus Diapherotrites archaeon]|nr:hypothetical protein [Candidatus Diapherotrites archaeon]